MAMVPGRALLAIGLLAAGPAALRQDLQQVSSLGQAEAGLGDYIPGGVMPSTFGGAKQPAISLKPSGPNLAGRTGGRAQLPTPLNFAPGWLGAQIGQPKPAPGIDVDVYPDVLGQGKPPGGPEREFELNRGLAVDTLLKDYPSLFDLPPDFHIFREEVVLQDVQGFSTSGLRAYKTFFKVLRSVAATGRALGYRANIKVMLMDPNAQDKSRIRLRWKIELFGKGDSKNQLSSMERDKLLTKLGFKTDSTGFDEGEGMLEGISMYTLDARGKINSHTIEVTQPPIKPLESLQRLFHKDNTAIPSN